MNSITLRYTPHEAPPTDVPYELRSFYSKEVWEKRIPAITFKASRYYKRTLELVWFFTFLACNIGAPIALFYVSLNILPEDAAEKKADQEIQNENNDGFFHDPFFHNSFDKYWKARLIALATWLAVVILFYTPMVVWKRHGQKKVNQMLERWANEDKASQGENCATMRLKHIPIISSEIRLEVKVPFMQMQPPSSFHPAAYLPAYLVNAAPDPNAAQYYAQTREGPATAPIMYAQGNGVPLNAPQQPLTSVSGVPLFNASDEKAPGYMASMGQIPAYGDEKHDFEDVKV